MTAAQATRSRTKQLAKAAEKAGINLPDIEDAFTRSDTLPPSVVLEAPVSTSKKRKAVSLKKNGTKMARKTPGDLLRQAPPPNWEEVYTEIKAMRADVYAPVDTMGCEQLGRTELDPKNSRFATLVGLMLSSQTKDEVTYHAMQTLRETLGGSISVEAMVSASIGDIEKAIGKVGFWRRKAQYLKRSAEMLKRDYGSDVPSTIDDLCSLPGVGPKMGHLCLQVAWNITTGIGVDTHVHRITQLLGWHKKKPENPEQTRMLLESWLPREKWHEINYMLVGFGQVICLPTHPRCNECTLASKKLCPSRRSITGVRKAKARSGVIAATPEDGVRMTPEVKEEAHTTELKQSDLTSTGTRSPHSLKMGGREDDVALKSENMI